MHDEASSGDRRTALWSSDGRLQAVDKDTLSDIASVGPPSYDEAMSIARRRPVPATNHTATVVVTHTLNDTAHGPAVGPMGGDGVPVAGYVCSTLMQWHGPFTCFVVRVA